VTGRWLTPNRARELLGLTWDQFNLLVGSGALVQELIGDHYSVSEASALEVLAQRAGIPVRQGPDIGDEAGREFRHSQDDYTDTPNDEGDEAP